MANFSHPDMRRKYSWWWDSHISPKNSKWLQENLTDMDAKVKSMIKLIEEDADSFARRAEMYYKKRPELMKFVEEFYRAYRALAERYNHAMGELRHAHRTIAKAFPDQVPFELVEDMPSKVWTPDRDLQMKLPVRALFQGDDDYPGLLESDLDKVTARQEYSEKELSDMCVKELHDIFGDKEAVPKSADGRARKGLKLEKEKEESSLEEMVQLSNENKDLKEKILHEAERAEKAESEVQGLKKALADMQAEKENVFHQYQQCLANLRNVELNLDNAQRESMRLSENSSRADIEVQTLKEALVQLEAEKNDGAAKHKEYLEKIFDLEATLNQLQGNTDNFNIRAKKAEIEAQILKDEISRLKNEKEAVLHQYNLCLQKILILEKAISSLENEAQLLKSQSERAETEVSELKKSLADLNKQKDASELQYKRCLETISKLEEELSIAKKDVKRLNNDVVLGNLKLKNSEEMCNLLEMSNQSLRAEAENLSKKIAIKDKELSEKQEELKSLQTSLQDEHLRYVQVEETLHTLQSLQSQSQDDQKALVLELQKVLQMLKDMEVSKHGLEEEIQQVRDENQNLSQMNLCSTVSVENKQNEILSLREIKERLEKEVSQHIDLSNSLQQEILRLKEEIQGLNQCYQAILDQLEAAGLKPESLGAAIKNLQDQNSTLREMYEQGCTEKEGLLKKLENMQKVLEKKVVVESSISDMTSELESSHETVKALQESCQSLQGEKDTFVAEKACLLSQLQAMTENMHNLLEKNAVLESSLSSAKIELEGLREKTKGLEGICELLKDERSYLLTERANLVSKLESVERRLEVLEKKYTGLEEKYADLVKEKDAVHCQVKELEVSLGVEKQERTNSQLHSQTRLAGLENQLHDLREENKWNKKEFEEEFDKSIKAQFEVSVLQKIIEDMEEKNASLIIECQKHVEASKLAEKLISELEGESLEQQVEAEILLDEIERMRLSIFQVFRALGTGPDCGTENKIENEQYFVHRILGSIQDMKRSISNHEDDEQLLMVENSVLLTLLEQLESKGTEIESQKLHLEKEFKSMAEKFAVVEKEKGKLLDANRKYEADATANHQHVAELMAGFESLQMKQAVLHQAFKSLEKVYLQVNLQYANLLKRFPDLEEKKYQAEQHTDAALLENLASAIQLEAFRNFGDEKLMELKSLLSDLNKQHEINSCCEREVKMLKEKLELKEAERVLLNNTVQCLESKIEGIREYNVQMKKDIVNGKESLLQTEGKLLVTEIKLEAADNLNLKLCRTVNDLKNEIQEAVQVRGNLENNVLQLSESNSFQVKEIESLQEVKEKLQYEIGLLREEVDEKMIREQTLCSELQSKNNEFELWEAEASAFYFGLQITSIHEVFFENKVHELTGLCWTIRNENASKTSEIEQMKEKVCLMENEINRLKTHIYSYAPVVAALRDDIIFLEHNALLQTKIKASRTEDPEALEVATSPDNSPQMILKDQSLISLQNLQRRIKAVGKSMHEMNKPVHKRAHAGIKQEPASGEIERLKPLRCLGRDKQESNRKKGHGSEISDTPKLQKIKTKSAELRNAVLTKDIPLDQVSDSSQHGLRRRSSGRVDDKMLELWQNAPDSSRELTIGESLRRSYKMTDKDIVYDQFENGNRKSDPPSTDSDMEKELSVDKLEVLTRSASRSREVNARRILERLSSDAQKLENLQITVQDLRQKLELNKKGRKPKNVDFETVEEQLLEAEETVIHLVDLNSQLVKTIEECPSPDEKASIQLKEAARKRRRKVTEQARKGSERIGRLQLELQKIQYILLQLEDEKKNRSKNKLFRSKTIVLRDFIYNGRKNSGKRKKGPFCGCFRPSTSGNGRSQ